MGRTLTLICAVLGAIVVFAAAAAVQAQAPGGAVPEAKQERPVGQPLRVEKLPPELEQILVNWSAASAKMTKLQGQHERLVYDNVFAVQKCAEGRFYYEAPDKGRIDITPADIKGKVAQKRGFTLKADRAERWICTGTEITQINDEAKTVQVFPIPPQVQGQNIMEGPLPFLFGMPPQKAKARFQLTLLNDSPQQAMIQAIPRLKADAQNYSKARIILGKKDWLPTAVELTDPSGNLVTVYNFIDLKINKDVGLLARIFIGEDKDPFNPRLPGYQRVVNQIEVGAGGPRRPAVELAAGEQGPAAPQAGPARGGNQVAVPSLVGLNWQQAKEILERSGLEAEFRRGTAANREELIHVVYEQEPRHKAPVVKGGKVSLTLYTKPAVQTSQKN